MVKNISADKASKMYDGRVSCEGCPFYPRLCTDRVRDWCSARTQKAFVAGSKWQKKKDDESLYK